jgi:hypothetical protein
VVEVNLPSSLLSSLVNNRQFAAPATCLGRPELADNGASLPAGIVSLTAPPSQTSWN